MFGAGTVSIGNGENMIAIQQKYVGDFTKYVIEVRDSNGERGVRELVNFINERVAVSYEDSIYNQLYEWLKRDFKTIQTVIGKMGLTQKITALSGGISIGVSYMFGGMDWDKRFYQMLQMNTVYLNLMSAEGARSLQSGQVSQDVSEFNEMVRVANELLSDRLYSWYKAAGNDFNYEQCDPRQFVIRCDGRRGTDYNWIMLDNPPDSYKWEQKDYCKMFAGIWDDVLNWTQESAIKLRDGMEKAAPKLADKGTKVCRGVKDKYGKWRDDKAASIDRLQAEKASLRNIAKDLSLPIPTWISEFNTKKVKNLSFKKFIDNEVTWLIGIKDKLTIEHVRNLYPDVLKRLYDLCPHLRKGIEELLRNAEQKDNPCTQLILIETAKLNDIAEDKNVDMSRVAEDIPSNDATQGDLDNFYKKELALLSVLIRDGVLRYEDIKDLDKSVAEELFNRFTEVQEQKNELIVSGQVEKEIVVEDIEYVIVSENDIDIMPADIVNMDGAIDGQFREIDNSNKADGSPIILGDNHRDDRALEDKRSSTTSTTNGSSDWSDDSPRLAKDRLLHKFLEAPADNGTTAQLEDKSRQQEQTGTMQSSSVDKSNPLFIPDTQGSVESTDKGDNSAPTHMSEVTSLQRSNDHNNTDMYVVEQKKEVSMTEQQKQTAAKAEQLTKQGSSNKSNLGSYYKLIEELVYNAPSGDTDSWNEVDRALDTCKFHMNVDTNIFWQSAANALILACVDTSSKDFSKLPNDLKKFVKRELSKRRNTSVNQSKLAEYM